MHAMDYREYPPPPALTGHVECLWRLRQPRPAGAPQTIYPDGRCELIVHLASPPRCWDTARGWHSQARTLFAAQRVVAVRLEATGPLDCIGVRLRPAVSNLLVRGAGARHRDQVVDLTGLDPAFSRALLRAARPRGVPATAATGIRRGRRVRQARGIRGNPWRACLATTAHLFKRLPPNRRTVCP